MNTILLAIAIVCAVLALLLLVGCFVGCWFAFGSAGEEIWSREPGGSSGDARDEAA